MKVTLLPSCLGGMAGSAMQYLTSFLVNDVVAIDAGSLGFYGTPQDQTRIKHVLLSHAHIDHIASLPIFLENVYQGGTECVTVHGSRAVLDVLRQDVFNNRVWPDFIDLSRREAPFLKLSLLAANHPLEVAGLRITPVPVNHIVPTMGFLVEEQDKAVIFASDTGPTEALWEAANQRPGLQAVFLEATFPNALNGLAEMSGHLTPALFAAEVGKLRRRVAVIAVHIKPRYYAQVVAELKELGLPNLTIGTGNSPYIYDPVE